MKTRSRIITIVAIISTLSCNTSKNETVESNKELMQFIKTEISTNDTYTAGDTILLSMNVINTGKKKYTFLPWGTPIENRLASDCLLIMHNNQILEYNGIMVKRIAPTKKDYVTLKHNETVSGIINILDSYNLNETGVYTIQYKEGKGLPKSNIIEIEIRK